MNKLLFITCLILSVSLNGYSQKKDKNAISNSVPYDSTANFMGYDVARYKGQELWLKELPAKQRPFGYTNFILKYKKDDEALNDAKNVYKCCDGYNSKYSELANRHFIVEEVLRHPKAKGANAKEYSDEYYLQLKEKSSGDIVYFKYDVNSEYSFPFVVMGYLDKLKQILVGKEYIFTTDIVSGAKELNSKQTVISPIGQKWKCTDVAVDNKEYELAMVVQNTKGQNITVPLSAVTDTLASPKKSYTATEAANMRRRFGVNSYNRILQQKIGMNMTQEMCRLSWGKPLEIKEAGTGTRKTEEWIYAAGSLTFRNNKLIKIK